MPWPECGHSVERLIAGCATLSVEALMSTTKAVLPMLSALVVVIVASGQERPAQRMTLDDRLATIEDRIDAIEDRLATVEGQSQRASEPDRLSMESEAKLDRLEVRVIRLENSAGNRNYEGMAQREMVERVRSLERQVARLRSSSLR